MRPAGQLGRCISLIRDSRNRDDAGGDFRTRRLIGELALAQSVGRSVLATAYSFIMPVEPVCKVITCDEASTERS